MLPPFAFKSEFTCVCGFMATVVDKADIRLVILEHVNKCPHWSKTPKELKDAAAAVVGSRA
jgi:hypothetical protein